MLKKIRQTYDASPRDIDELYGFAIDACASGPLCETARQWRDGNSRGPAETALFSRTLATCKPESLEGLIDNPNLSLAARIRYVRKFQPKRRMELIAAAVDAGEAMTFFEAVGFANPPFSPAERDQILALTKGSERLERYAKNILAERPALDAGRLEDLAERLSTFQTFVHVAVALDGGIRPEMKEAVVTCARSDGKGAEVCLGLIASQDWETARQIALSLPASRANDSIVTFRRYPTPEGVLVDLRRAGVDAGQGRSTTGALLTSGAMTGARGLRSRHLDALLDLAAPALDDVVVIERAAKTESQSARLEAFMGDAKYVIEFAPGCKVEDPEQVLGFLNVLMRARPAAPRYYTFRVWDSATGRVGVFTSAQFDGLVDAGLVFPVPAHVASAPRAGEDPIDGFEDVDDIGLLE